jgi:hypothetical protein
MSEVKQRVVVSRRAMLRGLVVVGGAGVAGTLLEACGPSAPAAPAATVAPTRAAQPAPAQAQPTGGGRLQSST